jgi:hypothetical protein
MSYGQIKIQWDSLLNRLVLVVVNLNFNRVTNLVGSLINNHE